MVLGILLRTWTRRNRRTLPDLHANHTTARTAASQVSVAASLSTTLANRKRDVLATVLSASTNLFTTTTSTTRVSTQTVETPSRMISTPHTTWKTPLCSFVAELMTCVTVSLGKSLSWTWEHCPMKRSLTPTTHARTSTGSTMVTSKMRARFRCAKLHAPLANTMMVVTAPTQDRAQLAQTQMTATTGPATATWETTARSLSVSMSARQGLLSVAAAATLLENVLHAPTRVLASCSTSRRWAAQKCRAVPRATPATT
mmetsp:Transcript_53130/g.78804  ORF Transcript_53130/g.78804 Transcript_53130/m.78804 type:complete len:257 (-) Transcript_53130:1229-1999(-)